MEFWSLQIKQKIVSGAGAVLSGQRAWLIAFQAWLMVARCKTDKLATKHETNLYLALIGRYIPNASIITKISITLIFSCT